MGQDDLVVCQICSRKFTSASILQHVRACEQSFVRKGFTYSAAKKRTIRVGDNEVQVNVEASESPEKLDMKKHTAWRKQHNVFNQCMANIIRQDIFIKSDGNCLPPPEEVDLSLELTQCPHCYRKFASDSADLHIPHCKERYDQLRFQLESPRQNVHHKELHKKMARMKQYADSIPKPNCPRLTAIDLLRDRKVVRGAEGFKLDKPLSGRRALTPAGTSKIPSLDFQGKPTARSYSLNVKPSNCGGRNVKKTIRDFNDSEFVGPRETKGMANSMPAVQVNGIESGGGCLRGTRVSAINQGNIRTNPVGRCETSNVRNKQSKAFESNVRGNKLSARGEIIPKRNGMRRGISLGQGKTASANHPFGNAENAEYGTEGKNNQKQQIRRNRSVNLGFTQTNIGRNEFSKRKPMVSSRNQVRRDSSSRQKRNKIIAEENVWKIERQEAEKMMCSPKQGTRSNPRSNYSSPKYEQ